MGGLPVTSGTVDQQQPQLQSYQHQEPPSHGDDTAANTNTTSTNAVVVVGTAGPTSRPRLTSLFSTSFCGMFQSKEHSKTDACALACCGFCLWERNQFLLENQVTSSQPNTTTSTNDNNINDDDDDDDDDDVNYNYDPKPISQRPVVLALITLAIVLIVVQVFCIHGSEALEGGGEGIDDGTTGDSTSTGSTNNDENSSHSKTFTGINDNDNNNVDNNNDNNNHNDIPSFFTIVNFFICTGIFWAYLEFQHARNMFRKKLAVQTYFYKKKQILLKQQEHKQQLQQQEETENTKDSTTTDAATNDNFGNDTLPGLALYIRQHFKEIRGKHGFCGCCIENDHHLFQQIQEEDDKDGGGDDDDNNDNEGFLACLWDCIAASCCGKLLFCWCQCCGMCATAQEHRHLRMTLVSSSSFSSYSNNAHNNDSSSTTNPTIIPLSLAKKSVLLVQRDYITMQPWIDYFPQIWDLRRNKERGIVPHFTTLSTLSLRLFMFLGILLGSLCILTAFPVQYSKWELAVLFATLLQPVVILFFVHWIWHRLDISIDALVKYFASGFAICTTMAIIYEMLVSLLISLALLVSVIISAIFLLASGKDPFHWKNQHQDDDESSSIANISLPVSYVIVFALLGAFLNSFMVAALVEEMCKYLCFWMVEHPDLENEVVLHKEKNGDGEKNDGTCILRPRVSLVSRGAAITIAMVTTALGFACAENLVYVFVYAPPGVESEFVTLFTRCVFPIHPLAAALQSIQVCRRDLEGDKSIKVGRIILPGWILHGTYDFTIMAFSILIQVSAKYRGKEGDNGKNTDQSKTPSTGEDESSVESLIVFALMLFIALCAFLYYFVEAWKQRQRLAKLDKVITSQSDENLSASLVANDQMA